ncbi:MAG: zinc metallopeptidase [Clostridiales bacterium]|nr:zinc metallopeptidase [Clostridiales bacterium]
MFYIVMIVIFIASLIIQGRLKSLVSKYSNVRTASGITSNEAVDQMLKENEVYGIVVKFTDGNLTDNYNSKEGTINLSKTTFNKDSIAAVAIAAHEAGHALQDAKGMGAYKVRQAIAPAVNFCSTAGVYVTIAGVVISYIIDKNLMNGIGYTISTIGIVMYSVAVIFYAVTLWIERDASKRGWKAMQQFGWVSQDQLSAAKKLLWAAGDTYAIALASSAATLLRLLVMRGGRRR